MKIKHFLLAAVLPILLCCEQKSEVKKESFNSSISNYLRTDSTYTINSAETTSINWDSLPTLHPKTWKTKVDFEELPNISTPTLQNYKTKSIAIDASKKRVYQITKNERVSRSLKIPKKGFTVLNKDTIIAVKKVLAGKPEAIPIKMNSKPNSTIDIQYLNVEQGLPQNKINQSLIDDKGYLWFATYGGGVMKFDGRTIVNFTEDEGVSSNFVNHIDKDSQGNIWLGSDGGGLMKFDGTHFWHYYYDQKFPEVFSTMAEDTKGDIWLGGKDGLAKLTNVGNPIAEVLIIYDHLPGIANERVDYIFEDSKNNIWIGTEKGLRRLTDENITFYDLGMTNISGLLEDNSGHLWISSYTDGFAKFDGKNLLRFMGSQKKDNVINCLLKDSKGNINIGTNENGLLIYNGKSLKAIGSKDGLLSDLVFGLTEDSSGNIWCSNFWNGVSKVGHSYFDEVLFEDKNTKLYSINQNYDQSIWFGSEQSTVYKYKHGNLAKIKLHDDQENFKVSDLTFEADNDVWFSSHDKLLVSHLQKDKLQHYQLLPEHTSDYVYDVFIDTKESPWFAINGIGIIRHYNNQFKLLGLSETNIGSSFYKIVEDNEGNYYFFGYETIYVLKEGKLSKFRTVGRYISDLLIDEGNRIWLATNQGVVKVEYNSETNQLSYNSYSDSAKHSGKFINGLEQNKNGDIWSTVNNKGIQVITTSTNTEDSDSLKISSINRSDGFNGLSFLENVSLIDSSANYWVGTKKGISKLDISSFAFNKNIPKVYLNSIRVNEVLFDRKRIANTTASKKFGFSKKAIRDSSKIEPFIGIPKNLELRHKYNTITFGFDAIEWKAPNDIHYQYKVDGLDRAWSMATKTNFATYRNIPSGKYVFKLRAAGKSGSWSKNIIYPFAILPPWWLSSWAKTLYALAAVFALWGFVQLRITAVRKATKKKYMLKLMEQATFEEGRQIEQERIARELHDGVLGSIFGIRIGLDGLLNLPGENKKNEQEKYIMKLSDLEREIRTLSHDLSPKVKASNLAFKKLILEHLNEHCQPRNLEYTLIDDASIEWTNIIDGLKFDIYRIIQESVQNIIKHSKATFLEVNFKKNENHIEMQISDNGIGFSEKQDMKGIGLKNIQSRVKSYKGTVIFKNNPTNGAQIKIILPIATT